MSPRRISAIAAVLIALGGAVAIANQPSLFSQSSPLTPAEQPAPGRGHDRNRDQGSWLKDLNLTPDQIQKIQAIRNRYKDQISQQRQTLQQTQRELRDLMAGNAPSNQVQQKYKQLQGLKQKLGDTRFSSMLEIREILSLEQRQGLVNHMKELRMNSKDRWKDRL